MTQPTHHRIPQCDSLNSAGRRCEKSSLHNRIEDNPIHKAGAVTWNSARGERLSLAEGMRRALEDLNVTLDPWQRHVAEHYFGEDELTEEEQLAQWWRDKAEAEIGQTVAKSIEYSSTDLADIGRSMARSAGRDVTEAHAAELAVAFYALGKVSRIMGAIERGDLPNMDSWLDLGVYARMAQRIREYGGWPGTGGVPVSD